jgi:hypothetical protein
MDIINSNKKQNMIYSYSSPHGCFCISINRVINLQLLHDHRAGVKKAALGITPIKHKSSVEHNLIGVSKIPSSSKPQSERELHGMTHNVFANS